MRSGSRLGGFAYTNESDADDGGRGGLHRQECFFTWYGTWSKRTVCAFCGFELLQLALPLGAVYPKQLERVR